MIQLHPNMLKALLVWIAVSVIKIQGGHQDLVFEPNVLAILNQWIDWWFLILVKDGAALDFNAIFLLQDVDSDLTLLVWFFRLIYTALATEKVSVDAWALDDLDGVFIDDHWVFQLLLSYRLYKMLTCFLPLRLGCFLLLKLLFELSHLLIILLDLLDQLLVL